MLYPAELPGPNPIAMRPGTAVRPPREQRHRPLDRSPGIYKFPAKRRQVAKRRSALRFQIETDSLRPVPHIEFAEQIAQMKFDRIDRHAEFPRQLRVAAAGL